MRHRIKEALVACGLGVAAAILAVSCGGAAPETSSKPATKASSARETARTVRTSASTYTSTTARTKTPTPTKAASHASATTSSTAHTAAPATTGHSAAPAASTAHTAAPATTGHSAAPAASTGHSTAPAAPASQAHAAPHWEYLGHGGQQYWGTMSPDFTACVDGSAQTPIDIRNPVLTPLKDMEFHYQPAMVTVLNNGHTIQANYGQSGAADGGYMVVDGKEYKLLQFHFHWPSEHTVDGQQFLMELHLVHKSADGKLAVLGIFLERGVYNPNLELVWSQMPPTAGVERSPGVPFDVTTVFPNDKRTFRYSGSLTTPPCSEGVAWHLFKTPVQASPAQADVFKSIIGFNSRYVQPLNGREVLEDSSIGQ